MTNEFVTIATGAQGNFEVEIKRSRFIGTAVRVEDEAGARAAIDAERKLYPDARHHCSAYSYLPVGWENGVQPVTHSSDDGEPSGTAGRPMLDVLVGSGLQNVCVVVTRYFGGVKLGTGGLVRAYSEATRGAIESAPQVRVQTLPVVSFQVMPDRAAGLEAWLRGRGWVPVDTAWANRVTFSLALDGFNRPELEAALSAQLGAPVAVENAGSQVVETKL